MKLCIECLQELFDNDNVCYYCKSTKLIDNNQINEIKSELSHMNNFERKIAIKDKKYNSVYYYMIKRRGKQYWINLNKKTKDYGVLLPTKQNLSLTPTVQCPYCHSTNTKKITTTSKAVHTAIFGIFSFGRNAKNFHCSNCGADF